MDEVDLNIIKELKKNAEKSFLKIAKKIGVSPKTVQNRYKKMREKRIIWHPTISIDLSKIGYEGKAYLMITNAPKQDAKLTFAAFNQMQNVIIISDVIGDFDVLAIALIKDLKSFAKLLQDIKEVPSVEQIEFAFVTDTQFPVDKAYDRLALQYT